MWTLKYGTTEFIYGIETHRKQTNIVTKGERRRDKLGVWDQQIQTTMYKIGNQQGPTVWHGELYSISCNKP